MCVSELCCSWLDPRIHQLLHFRLCAIIIIFTTAKKKKQNGNDKTKHKTCKCVNDFQIEGLNYRSITFYHIRLLYSHGISCLCSDHFRIENKIKFLPSMHWLTLIHSISANQRIDWQFKITVFCCYLNSHRCSLNILSFFLKLNLFIGTIESTTICFRCSFAQEL